MADKKQTEVVAFVNPFTPGVTYSEFVKSIPAGSSIEKHCAGFLSEEEITWIASEIDSFESNRKQKTDKNL